MALNKGQINVSGFPAVKTSYGDQSPSADATPLPWLVGDIRWAITADPTLLGWRCTVSGTPGTWVAFHAT